MRFSEYVYAKAVTLSFLGISGFLVGMVLALSRISGLFIGMLAVLYLALVLVWLFIGFWTERQRIRKLEKIVADLPEKYLLGEVLPRPVDPVEKQYYRIMKEISRSAVGTVEKAVKEKEEYCDYVESWIHEIKTPLTACSLILDNEGNVRKLRRELKRADNLTESILYYARMRAAQKDVKIREFHAEAAVREAVESQMELLIEAKIGVEVQGDFTVRSDDRAVCFILRQLLINCAKYCPGCHVSVTAESGKIAVEDDGPGIPSHEVSRVTERGFIGSNGKKLGGSTGMGLYIVNELCRRLDIALEIVSEQGKYTRITLTFPGNAA